MDLRQAVSDPAVRDELLNRFDELAAKAPGGFESLEGGLTTGAAENAVDGMTEGTYTPGSQPGLEAIIERFTRPVHLVQDRTFTIPADSFPNSEEVKAKLEGGRAGLERAIPSSGRIDLRNGRLDWVGTGWMVADDVAVTNRHVAEEFAVRTADGFAFKQNFEAPPVRAEVDWCHEHRRDTTSIFRVTEVLWIEPPESIDVALVRIGDGEDGRGHPPPIDLMTREEIAALGPEPWIGVVGYPARDSRNDAADQQRIFDGIYNVKRVAPGQVMSISADSVLHHDATTLGGNSGSVVLELESGKAIGLHFGGVQRDRNSAVQASRVRDLVAAHAG